MEIETECPPQFHQAENHRLAHAQSEEQSEEIITYTLKLIGRSAIPPIRTSCRKSSRKNSPTHLLLHRVNCMFKEKKMAKELKSSEVQHDDMYTLFDPTSYMARLWNTDGTPGDYHNSRLQTFHECFSSDKYDGGRLLEICSGVSVDGVISASKCFSEIYMSEYSQSGKDNIKAWLDGKQSQYIDSSLNVVAELEGLSGEEVSHRVKKAVKDVLHCDLTTDQPLGALQNTIAPVDALISCHTVSAAASDKEDYNRMMANIAGLIKPGGLFVFLSSVKLSFYMVSDVKYRNLALSADEIKAAVEKSGCRIEKTHIVSAFNDPNISDAKYCCFIQATKL